MKEFQPFVMERMMSKWENVVDYNLSESGVHPMTLGELLAMDGKSPDALGEVDFDYPQANGTVELRRNIANYYPGAGPDNVLITVGAAEANYLTLHTLLDPGDEAVIMMPNYMQVWGVAKNHGLRVKTFNLLESEAWAPDLAELERVVGPETKLIAVCNPNNPTGRIMTEVEMSAVVATAERVGAWILADEVYRGAERVQEEETPSFFGRYDKVLAIGSMSKAYGLPGLRVGWVVGPQTIVDDIWRRHEYTTITATMLSNILAAYALSPEVRPRLIKRTRDYIRKGFPVLEEWMAQQNGLFNCTPPQASAVSFVRYHLDMNSTELMEKLCREASVFVGAGDSFGMDHHLRIAFGQDRTVLEDAFARMEKTLQSCFDENAVA